MCVPVFAYVRACMCDVLGDIREVYVCRCIRECICMCMCIPMCVSGLPLMGEFPPFQREIQLVWGNGGD